jgi:hypothetical protein
MILVFEALYNESNNISKGKKVLAQYQKLLKEVPNWNNHMINQHVEKMTSSCGWFSDLLAAVFVSYVKILSSVRLGSENKKISLKLPSNDVFVHGCFTNAAKELYKDPFVYHEEMSEYDRDANLTRRFIACIENTVKEMIPIQEILKTYISHKDEIEMNSNPEPDSEDPEVEEEEPFPPPEEEPTADEATTTGEAPVAEGGLAQPAPLGGVEGGEVKNVQLTGNAASSNEDDGVLFPDAN